jgi:hypothetical protein
VRSGSADRAREYPWEECWWASWGWGCEWCTCAREGWFWDDEEGWWAKLFMIRLMGCAQIGTGHAAQRQGGDVDLPEALGIMSSGVG